MKRNSHHAINNKRKKSWNYLYINLYINYTLNTFFGFWGSVVVKSLPANAGEARDMGSIPGLGRYPRVRNSNQFQYFCLKNSMDRGAWAPWGPWGHKESDMTAHTNTHTFLVIIYTVISVQFNSVQFSSVAQSCPTLCDPMNHSTPGLPVHHQLLEFAQTHAHRVSDAIQPSHLSVVPFSSCPQSLPASGSFPMSQLFAWSGQSIGVSASTSVPPMNTQYWSPLGWTGWISLQCKGLSRVFSKHQFFGAQFYSQSNSHIHTWPLEKP